MFTSQRNLVPDKIRQPKKPDPALGSRNNLPDIRIIAVGDNQPAPRHNRNQLAECPLNRREIGKDVGMIKLEIIQDDSIGKVVDKFAALIKKRCVILISFDDKMRPGPEPRPRPKICWNPANQKSGRLPG